LDSGACSGSSSGKPDVKEYDVRAITAAAILRGSKMTRERWAEKGVSFTSFMGADRFGGLPRASANDGPMRIAAIELSGGTKPVIVGSSEPSE
jgi:hypothetical protein